uniref:Phosphofructokinase domain-containing protein n=1 Tax=Hemiselmis andersenii TaxID=464988 RepID=A0A7S1DMT0_HEMAN
MARIPLWLALTLCAAVGTCSGALTLPAVRRSSALTPGVRPVLRVRGGEGDDVKFDHQGVYGTVCTHSMTLTGVWSTKVRGKDVDAPAETIRVIPMKVDCIAEWIPNLTRAENPMVKKMWPVSSNFCDNEESIISVLYVNSKRAQAKEINTRQWLRAGPRREIRFKPEKVVAAIVTCGGLCPGLNNVIREVTMTLLSTYKARKVWGIPFGYMGFYSEPWRELTEEGVDQIHRRGGTILGSSRGGHDLEKIMEALIKFNVNQVFVVGGDGTHRGANAISKEAASRQIAMTVAGVPKTIDNDVAFIDKSFGFDTAVQAAASVIQCASVEATDAHDGIGIVKLMGRECGFVAMHATLAAGDVDICLIPEVSFDLDLLFDYVKSKLDTKGNCLIVVAEGAGQEYFEGVDLGTDLSGNKKLPDVGQLIKDKAKDWFKSNYDRTVNVRYIDPSYQVRSVPTIASDSIYCSALGSNVVHGAMTGLTGFSCGKINDRYAYIPIDEMCDPKRTVRIDSQNRMYMRMLRQTGQPNFQKDGGLHQ